MDALQRRIQHQQHGNKKRFETATGTPPADATVERGSMSTPRESEPVRDIHTDATGTTISINCVQSHGTASGSEAQPSIERKNKSLLRYLIEPQYGWRGRQHEFKQALLNQSPPETISFFPGTSWRAYDIGVRGEAKSIRAGAKETDLRMPTHTSHRGSYGASILGRATNIE